MKQIYLNAAHKICRYQADKKKIICLIVLLCMLSILCIVSRYSKARSAAGLSFEQRIVTVYAGEDIVLKTNMPYLPVSFKSSNELIVSVNRFGRVKALRTGVAKVTAVYFGKTAECIIYVK